jgi:hypothetical protein
MNTSGCENTRVFHTRKNLAGFHRMQVYSDIWQDMCCVTAAGLNRRSNQRDISMRCASSIRSVSRCASWRMDPSFSFGMDRDRFRISDAVANALLNKAGDWIDSNTERAGDGYVPTVGCTKCAWEIAEPESVTGLLGCYCEETMTDISDGSAFKKTSKQLLRYGHRFFLAPGCKSILYLICNFDKFVKYQKIPNKNVFCGYLHITPQSRFKKNELCL